MQKIYRNNGMNLSQVLEKNRAAVLRIMRRRGKCSRAELAKLTGLNPATITNIANEFLGAGLMRETGTVEPINTSCAARGRRAVMLELAGEEFKIIGSRLTRHYVEIGLYDISGKLYDHFYRYYPKEVTAGSALRILISAIYEMMEHGRQEKVTGIGVALPGPFLRSEGTIFLNEFPGWEFINIREVLTGEFSVPVFFEHDANAGALAICSFEEDEASIQNMIFLAIGHGIGAGIISRGEIQRGNDGIFGEVGHMSINYDGPVCQCGNRGCLENYCSTIAITKRARQRLMAGEGSVLEKDCTFDEIVSAYLKKDGLAVEVVEETAGFLAVGIVSLYNILNPGLLIIGDEIVRLGDDFLAVVRRKVEELVFPFMRGKVEIRYSTWNSMETILGASVMAADYFFENLGELPKEK